MALTLSDAGAGGGAYPEAYMFYWSNLGRFGAKLPTDLEGFVPEEGDQPEEFRWEAGVEWTREEWEAFVTDAVLRTEEALCAVGKWRDSDHACSRCAGGEEE